VNSLVRATLYLLAGKPLPPRCTACRTRIWGGNWSDMRSPESRYWHPLCAERPVDEPARTITNNPPTSQDAP
jgi:hypothetical protein